MRHDYQFVFDEFFSIHDETVREKLVADYEAYVARFGGNPMSFHRWLGNRVEIYGEGGALVLAAEIAALRTQLTTAEAALRAIQQMTREFVEANRELTKVNPVKAFWRIAHIEKIAREALALKEAQAGGEG